MTAGDAAQLLKRLERLETEQAARATMAEYMRVCDTMEAPDTLARLKTLFAPDAMWEGLGPHYSHTLGRHEGRDAILAMMSSYQRNPPHFQLNLHFLTGEYLHWQNRTLCGRWIMAQLSSFTAGGSSLASAEITARFTDDGRQISYFGTTRLFGRSETTSWDQPVAIPTPLVEEYRS